MTDNNHDNPRVFISYSWDSPEHRLWVESFAQELRKAGIDARLDAWRNESQSIDDFMMIELERADFVLAVCTPQYKQKIVQNAEGGTTASGFEMGTAAALRRTGGKDVIPVLRSGTWLESAPSSLVSYRFYDFTLADVSSEFAQLRDRLLGHVRRPPELGARSGPAAAPDLPDIFAGGSKPAPASQTRRADHSRAAPPAESVRHPVAAPPAATPSSSGGGKKWIWAAVGAAAVIVLLLMIPSSDDSGGTPEPGPQTFAPQQEDTAGDTGSVEDYPQEDEFSAEPTLGDFVPEESAEMLVADDPSAGWGIVSDETGCSVLKQLAANTWLQMGYDAAKDVFVLATYDPAWEVVEVGKLYRIVMELDDDENLAYPGEAQGVFDDGIPGVYLEFTDMDFLQGLAQRHLLSFYWDVDPYGDYWVMDAELRGSTIALQSLIQCQEEKFVEGE